MQKATLEVADLGQSGFFLRRPLKTTGPHYTRSREEHDMTQIRLIPDTKGTGALFTHINFSRAMAILQGITKETIPDLVSLLTFFLRSPSQPRAEWKTQPPTPSQNLGGFL